jgi:hypothetical protein
MHCVAVASFHMSIWLKQPPGAQKKNIWPEAIDYTNSNLWRLDRAIQTAFVWDPKHPAPIKLPSFHIIPSHMLDRYLSANTMLAMTKTTTDTGKMPMQLQSLETKREMAL